MPDPTPIRAIRAKCLDCSGDSWTEVKLCQMYECPLWRYRLGMRPETAEKKHSGMLNPGTVEKMGNAQTARQPNKEGPD